MRRPSDISGFSLLEVLVSLVIMGMIGILMNSLFTTSTQVWRRSITLKDLVTEATTRRQLEIEIQNLPRVDFDNKLETFFQTSEKEIKFSDQRDQKTNALNWVTLRLRDGRFVREHSVDGTRTVLSNVGRVSIRYFGNKTADQKPAWTDDWQDSTLLPKLIFIESSDTNGNTHPPIAVEPAKLTRQSEISLSSLEPPG